MYPEFIKNAAMKAVESLEEKFPGIKEKVYEKADENWRLVDRLQMSIYLELIFMGYIRTENHDEIMGIKDKS